MPDGRDYRPEDLIERARAAFVAVGVPEQDALLVADALVAADRRGIYSHGLLRLPLYVAALEAGGMNRTPDLQWHHEHGAVATLDADSAMGQVGMAAAVDRVIELAAANGIGAVAVEHSTHYGAGNYWSDRITAAGMIGIVTSTTGPVVAPYGGFRSVLGTNPLTIGAPSAGDHALTADLATSAGAFGKVLAARNSGEPIPEGWAVGPDGEPTTDAATAIAGSLATFGGHKGSAIAVLVEVLAASLTDARYANDTVDIWSNPGSRMNTGHLVIAIDPASFLGAEHTATQVLRMQEAVRGAGAADGVLAPGDPEFATAQASAERVSLAGTTCASLDALFDRLDLEHPQPLED